MCVHTIVLDPKNPGRIFIAISPAGVFRSDDAGKTWKPVNQGLKSPWDLPDPQAEVVHYVHQIDLHPSHPNTFIIQQHSMVMPSVNPVESWSAVTRYLP